MNYQIIKLVSGEEIIGDVVENSDSSLKINRPMVFRTMTMLDPKGNPYDITMLKDWLLRSDSKMTEVVKSHISSMIIPNEKTLKLYNSEINRLDKEIEYQEEMVSSDELASKILEDMDPNMDDMFDNIINTMNQIQEEQKNQKRKRKKRRSLDKKPSVPDFDSLIPEELKSRPMIYLSMVIPPETIMNLVTAGILDPEQLLQMIEEVKKKNNFTGDEKKREDFGNKLSDWNPDPQSDDY